MKVKGLRRYNDEYWFLRLLPLGFATVLCIVFLFCDQTRYYDSGSILSRFLPTVTVLFSVAFGCFLKQKNKLSYVAVTTLLIICGFSLRLGYALDCGWLENQHDVETLRASGHISYIYSFVSGDGLPDTNTWQFSHPPLHHMIAALLVKLSQISGFAQERSFENIQLLTVMYSTLMLFASVSVCKELKFKDSTVCFLTAILSFHPFLIILGGSINNDCLLIMLTLYFLLFLIKWCNSHSLKNATLCGLFGGMAMMTKVSAALLGLVAAVTVLTVFFSDKQLKFKKFVLHAALFSAIFLPLGLWHPIRNYILFEQPLGYVAPISTSSPLYTGDISVLKRLVLPTFDAVKGPYVDVWNEYNLWWYLIRNSLFGEYNFGSEGVAVFDVMLNFCLIALSQAAAVFVLLNLRKISRPKSILPVYVLFFVQSIFFIYFNFKYPFGCTMDFRYAVPLLFCGVYFIGCAEGLLADDGVGTALSTVAKAIMTAFCLSTLLIFL